MDISEKSPLLPLTSADVKILSLFDSMLHFGTVEKLYLYEPEHYSLSRKFNPNPLSPLPIEYKGVPIVNVGCRP